MTLPNPGEQRPGRSAATDPEALLAQALRAMAGGGRPRPDASADRLGAPLTVLQVLLLATIAGVLLGGTAGLISLLV